jgi:hypothetical protein
MLPYARGLSDLNIKKPEKKDNKKKGLVRMDYLGKMIFFQSDS